jgi:ophiobolin F synthase
MNINEAMTEHKDFEASFDRSSTHKPAAGTRAARLKKLVSQVLLEAINVDREKGNYMLERYQKGWAAIMEKSEVPEFNSLDDYLAFRTTKFGMKYVKLSRTTFKQC